MDLYDRSQATVPSSDEEEEEEEGEGAVLLFQGAGHRTSRPRRRRRHSCQISPNRSVRIRSSRSEGGRTGEEEERDEKEEEEERVNLSGYSSRDLSPVEQVREYLGDCAGEMVEDFERICQQMSDKMSTLGETAMQKSNAFVQGSREIVHRTAKGGADMVKGAACKSCDMAHTAVSKSGAMAKSAVAVAERAAEVPGRVVEKIKEHWRVHHFDKLPGWMRDNEYLRFGHRPELNSFSECFKSIFMIHTETGNIWTHLIGFLAFITITIVFYIQPLCDYCHVDIKLADKLIFLFFFIGAILCLGLSSLFHTVCCHSEWVSKLFCKLDYVGISLLTVGSFIPWIYYGFYCQFTPKLVYLTCMSILGIVAIVVTMLDRFSSPEYRPARAFLFVSLGGFGLVPATHFILQSGLTAAMTEASLHWLLIMAALYMSGALLYGARIPERFLPGKCDIWFHSHQIFHVLVIAAAFVHYRGISDMAVHRLTKAGECIVESRVLA